MLIFHLKKRAEFIKMTQHSHAIVMSAFIVQIYPSSLLDKDQISKDFIRVGFTASKKIGSAVNRNYAKRRLKEASRKLLPLYGMAGYDYVFIARKRICAYNWSRLIKDMKSVLQKLAKEKKFHKAGRKKTK